MLKNFYFKKNKALELEKEVKNDSSSDTITLNLYYKPTVLKVRKTVSQSSLNSSS